MPRTSKRSGVLPLMVLALGAWWWSTSFVFVGIPQQVRVPQVARAQEGSDAEVSKGDTVEAVFPDDGMWYPGVVDEVNDDGTYEVRWDDADGGPETSPCKPEDVKKITPRTALDDLKIGSKVKGKVQNVAPFGVFVDINAESDGLVHVSKIPAPVPSDSFKVDDSVEAEYPEDGEIYPGTISKDNGDGTYVVAWSDPDGGPESHSVKKEKIKTAPKEYSPGEEVEVWIERVQDDRISLSMMPPPDFSGFSGLHPEEWLEGTVAGIAKFGCFVNVNDPNGGPPQRGLVHISQMTEGFVEDPWAEVEEGQKVKVRVLAVDEERMQMKLTMVE